MSVAAAQKQYRDEMIDAFERGQSTVREMVTTEVVVKGNQAEFLVAGSGGATAVTRGVNGMIPAREDSNVQTTVTLSEWHDLVRKTRFNVFASQGNQRALMQKTTMKVINRKIDDGIITQLNTATQNTGAATTASEALALKAGTVLQNNDVEWDGDVFALITPAFHAYLMQIRSYASSDYVSDRPVITGGLAWQDKRRIREWQGVKWMVHGGLPGKGTSAEKCFMFHKSAIGHAFDTGGMNTAIGYDDEQDYSFARCSGFMGSGILQSSGIIVMNHDGSAYTAS